MITEKRGRRWKGEKGEEGEKGKEGEKREEGMERREGRVKSSKDINWALVIPPPPPSPYFHIL